MENKVIQHIVKNKILYFIAIGLIGLTGVVGLDFSSPSPDSNLQGNVEELIDSPPKLSISKPTEGSKFREGDKIEISWKNDQANAATTYRVYAQELEDPNALPIAIAPTTTETSVGFTFPFETITAEQEMKTFTINVAESDTKTVVSSTITIANTERIVFTQPQQQAEFAEGDKVTLTWQDKDSKAGTSYRLDLVNVNDSQERIIVEKSVTKPAAEFSIPFNALTAEEANKTYQAVLQVVGENTLVMGPKFTVTNKEGFLITQPDEGETVEVALGEDFLVEWEGLPFQGQLFSVYLHHSSANTDVLLAEQNNASSATVKVPETILPGEYRVTVKSGDQLAEGGLVKVFAKDLNFNQVLAEEKQDIPSVQVNEPANIPSLQVKEESTPDLQITQTPEKNQTLEPVKQVQQQEQNTQNTNSVTDTTTDTTDTSQVTGTSTLIKNPTFNKTPLPSSDPLSTVPGFERN